jgi:hypothetical protein
MPRVIQVEPVVNDSKVNPGVVSQFELPSLEFRL